MKLSRFSLRYRFSLFPLFQLTLVTPLLLLTSSLASAGSATWSSTNIQYLKGSSYSEIYFDTTSNSLESRDASAEIITLEHVNGWKYGDNFFFVDITSPFDSDGDFPTSFYGEVSPRLSLSSISGKSLQAGPIKDVLIATTVELGEGFHNYLYGLAVDFNIPHVPVAQLNVYARNEIKPDSDLGNQLTLVWMAPFNIGGASFTFEGFLDYAFGMDHAEDNIITAPRFLFDLGNTWGAPGALQVGIEYQIWRNKYGLDGIDEDVAQAMLKWIW